MCKNNCTDKNEFDINPRPIIDLTDYGHGGFPILVPQ